MPACSVGKPTRLKSGVGDKVARTTGTGVLVGGFCVAASVTEAIGVTVSFDDLFIAGTHPLKNNPISRKEKILFCIFSFF